MSMCRAVGSTDKQIPKEKQRLAHFTTISGAKLTSSSSYGDEGGREGDLGEFSSQRKALWWNTKRK